MYKENKPAKVRNTSTNEPEYYDKILRDRGFHPRPYNKPKPPKKDPGTAPGLFMDRDKTGKAVRAYSSIMTKGSPFKGTF